MQAKDGYVSSSASKLRVKTQGWLFLFFEAKSGQASTETKPGQGKDGIQGVEERYKGGMCLGMDEVAFDSLDI